MAMPSTVAAVAASRPRAPSRRRPCRRRRRRCARGGAAAGAAARICSGSAAATAARKLSSSSSRIRRASKLLAAVRAEVVVLGYVSLKTRLDLVRRDVGEAAAIAQVFHVAPVVLVERVEDGIGRPVELERLDAEARAEREVERRRRFDPLAVEQELGVAVEHEEIGAHLRGELGSGEVVLDVGEADTRRDPAARAHAASSAALGMHQPLPRSSTAEARNVSSRVKFWNGL